MRIAIYAGTFDPITLGHLSVIREGAEAFDELIVLVADNPKKKPLFTVAERQELIVQATREMGNVSVDASSELVVQYARSRGARFLIRGIRDAMDTEYETSLANINRVIAPEIITFFVPSDPNLSKVSSTRLKEMAQNNENGADCCPQSVWSALLGKVRGVRASAVAQQANCDL